MYRHTSKEIPDDKMEIKKFQKQPFPSFGKNIFNTSVKKVQHSFWNKVDYLALISDDEETEEDTKDKNMAAVQDISEEVKGEIEEVQPSISSKENSSHIPFKEVQGSLWTKGVHLVEISDEEIEEEIEEEIQDENTVMVQDLSKGVKGEMEEIMEQLSVSSREDFSYSSFSSEEEAEEEEETEKEIEKDTEDENIVVVQDISEEVKGEIEEAQEQPSASSKENSSHIPFDKVQGSLWTKGVHLVEISDEEEIEEEIEEETQDENIAMVQDLSKEVKGEIEEIQEQLSVSSREDFSYSSFSEEEAEEEEETEEEIEKDTEDENIVAVQDISEEVKGEIKEGQEQPSASSKENSSHIPVNEMLKQMGQNERLVDELQKALEEERKTKGALEEALKKEERAFAQQKEALKQEQKDKDALAKTLKKVTAEKDSLYNETEAIKTQVADLKKTQKEHQKREAQLKSTITEMTAGREEDKKVIEKLKNDLKVCSSEHEKEIAKREKVNWAEIKALKERLTEQQKKSLEKDKQIQSLDLKNQDLQRNIEAKDKTVSSLQNKEAGELINLTHKNQQLTSENARLQDELKTKLNETKLDRKQFQEDREDRCSRLEEAIMKEKALCKEAAIKIEMQKEELFEKTLALEKSKTMERCLRSSLRKEKKRFEQVLLQKQEGVDHLTILKDQLSEALESSESLKYDIQTLRMENADIVAKFKAADKKYDRLKSEHLSLSERHEKMMSQKNYTISENQGTISKFQYMVDEHKEQQLENRIRQARLEDALQHEKTRNSELQQRVHDISSALEKQRTTSEKHCVELKGVIEKLKKDLEACSREHKKEIAKREKVKWAEIKDLKERLTEQQKESLEKDKQIQSLDFNNQDLQRNIEVKDKIISSLPKWASDLKEEQAKNCKLQRDYEAAVSQQKKEAEELINLTKKNQQLTSENERLQDELTTTINERRLDRKQFQEDREDRCSRLQEVIMKEKALSREAAIKIEMQKEELFEKTLALENNKTMESCLRSSIKREKKRFEQVLLQKQTAVGNLRILKDQLREAFESSESLKCDIQTLRMENADIVAKFKTGDKMYDRLKSEHLSLSERHEKMMSQKNDTIFENQGTIAKLQYMVDELKEQQSESRIKQARLEDALQREKTRNSELQQRVHDISSAHEKERTTSEKHHVKLNQALTKQIETLEEKQKLAVALQQAQDSFSMLQEQQLAQANFQKGHTSDAELRLNQQKAALDERTKTLQELQQEYIDLGRRHSDINSDYRDLLKTHTALQIRYERLSYAQGNPRPEFILPQFTVTVPKHLPSS